MRLAEVADEIPDELRRIIEYLNDQLGDSRLVALEVPQFAAASGITTLVLQIVAGSLDPPVKQESARARGQWDEERLIAELSETEGGGTQAADAGRVLLKWASDNGHGMTSGTGTDAGSVTLFVPLPGEPRVMCIMGPGYFQ